MCCVDVINVVVFFSKNFYKIGPEWTNNNDNDNMVLLLLLNNKVTTTAIIIIMIVTIIINISSTMCLQLI